MLISTNIFLLASYLVTYSFHVSFKITQYQFLLYLIHHPWLYYLKNLTLLKSRSCLILWIVLNQKWLESKLWYHHPRYAFLQSPGLVLGSQEFVLFLNGGLTLYGWGCFQFWVNFGTRGYQLDTLMQNPKKMIFLVVTVGGIWPVDTKNF